LVESRRLTLSGGPQYPLKFRPAGWFDCHGRPLGGYRSPSVAPLSSQLPRACSTS
jgi:hypothetical protein